MRDLLFVDDCIDAVLKLAVSPSAENSVFNIGSGRIVSISDVAHTAVEVSGERGVEITDLEQNIEHSPTALIADIRKVQATVDWSPKTNLTEGLRKIWESYVTPGNPPGASPNPDS
jgi:UDP-glucose 4-epimerase